MTDRPNLAGVVIAYKPTSEIHLNIPSYLDLVDHLFIIDNSENPENSFYNNWAGNDKITVILNRENLGIAEAINLAAQKSIDLGFGWLLTMDQDSRFDKEMAARYRNDFLALALWPELAVMGPSYAGHSYRENIEEVMALITSGSIFNLDVFLRIGKYDERLFIDEVDHEYCYRARASGYKIVRLNEIELQHSLGKKIQVKTLTGKQKETIIHKPFRIYYMVRNSLFVFKEYGKAFPEEIKTRKHTLRVTIKNNLLYGGAFFSYLKFIVKGYRDFSRNRFGKL